MSSVQRFFAAIFPASWTQGTEAESRAWMVKCQCGFEQSTWDAGGIRWKASGSFRRCQSCSGCGQYNWHTVYRKES